MAEAFRCSHEGENSMTIAKRILRGAAIGAALLTGWVSASAQAGYVVTLQQVGFDVVAKGSGPLDLTGFCYQQDTELFSNIFTNGGRTMTGASIVTGPAGAIKAKIPVTVYGS